MPVLDAPLVARDGNFTLGPGSDADLLLSIAPIMFGLIWNWFLLGTLMVQVYYYYMAFPKDSKILKGLVYSVVILDLLQTALTTHASYFTFVVHYNNPKVLSDPARTIIAQVLFDGVIGTLVQGFYAWRIWQLGVTMVSKMVLIPILVIISLVSLLQCAGSMAGSFLFVKLQPHPIKFFTSIDTGIMIWLSSGVACDVIIALTMSFLVGKAKEKSRPHSSNLLTKILVRIVATGVLTAFCAMLDLILFIRSPSTDMYETPAYVLGKLFSNALLVNLNIRAGGVRGHTTDLDVSSNSNALSSGANRSLTYASTSRTGRSAYTSNDSYPEYQPRVEVSSTKDMYISPQNDPMKHRLRFETDTVDEVELRDVSIPHPVASQKV